MVLFACVQVACLIGFIIHATTLGYAGGGLVWFATISGFINAVIWFILHLVHAIPQILANYYIVSYSPLLVQPNLASMTA